MGCGPQETFRACADIAIRRQQGGSRYNNIVNYTEKNIGTRRQQGESSYKTIARVEKIVKAVEVTEGPRRCVGSGLYRGLGGMERWCSVNCNNTPTFCPTSHCHCYQ